MGTLKNLGNQILQELEADRAYDDVTAQLLQEAGDQPGRGVVRAKAAGVFSGAAVAEALSAVVGSLSLEVVAAEGRNFETGAELIRLSGPYKTLLGVERTFINLISHLCGVATLTRKYVHAVVPHRARILATRKTLLGLRDLQLTAVRAGGGHVHRRSLSDGILIKDNHQELVSGSELLRRARLVRSPLHRIEVEVQSLEALKQLLPDLPEVIMLDNFTLPHMVAAVRLIDGRCQIEVSGGVDLESIEAIAALGVDYISVGRLTHSAPSVDMSMDLLLS